MSKVNETKQVFELLWKKPLREVSKAFFAAQVCGFPILKSS